MDKDNAFVIAEYTVDTNNLTGYQNGNACSYSNQGDCDACCEPVPYQG